MHANVVELAPSTRSARQPLAEPRRSFPWLTTALVTQRAQVYLEADLGTPESQELILGLLLALADQREAVHLAAQLLTQKPHGGGSASSVMAW